MTKHLMTIWVDTHTEDYSHIHALQDQGLTLHGSSHWETYEDYIDRVAFQEAYEPESHHELRKHTILADRHDGSTESDFEDYLLEKERSAKKHLDKHKEDRKAAKEEDNE